jgi:hypothetical protein
MVAWRLWPSRMSLFAMVDAFIAEGDALDRDQLREWLPELIDLRQELENIYERSNPWAMYARPDPRLAMRLHGIRQLIGRAQDSYLLFVDEVVG